MADEQLEEYAVMMDKMHTLSKISARRFTGISTSDEETESRQGYIEELELFKHLATVQIAAILRVLMRYVVSSEKLMAAIKAAMKGDLSDEEKSKLGVNREDLITVLNGELKGEMEIMERSLAITGWCSEGPIFDIARFQEIVRGWPNG